MGKVQRGRWSTKKNVLKQDRIIYDDEGYLVGFHDGRYKLGRYTVPGFSEQFYRDYEKGYNDAYGKFDSNGREIGLDEHFKNLEKQSKNRSGCAGLFFLSIAIPLLVYFI